MPNSCSNENDMKLLFLGVVVVTLSINVSKAYQVHVVHNVEIVLPECSTEGGDWVWNRCVCKSGFTGSACEIYMHELFNNEENIKSLQRTQKSNLRDYTLNEYLTPKGRMKRQALSNENTEGSGSGSETILTTEQSTIAEQTPTTEQNTTEDGQTTTAEQITTTVGGITCSNDEQFFNGECVAISAFDFRARVDKIFNENFSDLTSADSVTFIQEFTDKVMVAMADKGLLSIMVNQLRNGSVIVDGTVNFNKSLELKTLDVGELFQRNVPDLLSVSVADFDECRKSESNTCDLQTTTCVNTDSSFECACKAGYLSKNTSKTSCNDVCTDFTCQNGGFCASGNNNEAICRCSGSFYGLKCEKNDYSWRQAAIGVAIALAAVLFLILVVLLYVFCRTRTGKSEFTDIPLVTGFRPKSEDTPKSYTNPSDVQEGEVERYQSDNGALTSSTTTFRPEVANTATDDAM
uniref:Uncharacterized LOC100185581 n=1 Tax=Ciona intestinalis TaxID=7719 RepID=F7B426_CIOIN|nr:uncharacterized protein LOC100185581 isoform X1 [Ciona intestinalis]|eukprot:XP_026695740.1 uncharacterized protein LOC100185581 isoform X1 [Ciona intestinalis]